MGDRDSQVGKPIRRILVAVDNSRDSMAALSMAASLARLLDAELQGLFVEDDSWYQLVEHGFFREVSTFTGHVHVLEEQHVRLHIRAHAERLRRVMEETARRYGITYTFRSVRGKVKDEILKALPGADLLTIGTFGRSVLRNGHLGSTARAILQGARIPVLVLQHNIRHGDHILVLDDGTERSGPGLNMAGMLASKLGKTMVVLRMPGSASPAQNPHRRPLYRGATRLLQAASEDPAYLTNMIRGQQTGLIIAHRSMPLFRGVLLETMIDRVRCPLLLMP